MKTREEAYYAALSAGDECDNAIKLWADSDKEGKAEKLVAADKAYKTYKKAAEEYEDFLYLRKQTKTKR